MSTQLTSVIVDVENMAKIRHGKILMSNNSISNEDNVEIDRNFDIIKGNMTREWQAC